MFSLNVSVQVINTWTQPLFPMRESLLGMGSMNTCGSAVPFPVSCAPWMTSLTNCSSFSYTKLRGKITIIKLKHSTFIAHYRIISCRNQEPDNMERVFQSWKLPLILSGERTEDTVKETPNWNCPEASKGFRLKVTKRDVENGWVACISFGPQTLNLVVIMVVTDQNRTLVDGIWSSTRTWAPVCKCTQFIDFTLKFPNCAHQNSIGADPKRNIHPKQSVTREAKETAARGRNSNITDVWLL